MLASSNMPWPAKCSGVARHMIRALLPSKSIAVVGSGDIDPNCAEAIDAHDLVFRFNGCRNFGAAGFRTDYLVLTNTGAPAFKFAFEPDGLNIAAVAAAGKILLARSPELVQQAIASHPKDEETWRTCDEALISNRLRSKRWSYIPARAYRAAQETLLGFGAHPTDQPSTGMITLFYIAQTMKSKYRTPPVKLFGFTHKGWQRHPWSAERQLIDSWNDWITRA